VLWNKEDCEKDEDVNLQSVNKSRPSMERAIRHPDGTMLADSEWCAIKSSARRIANELAGLPASTRQGNTRRTKLYYRTYHARDWTDAITRLETEQPLLKLCSANWKAEHTLGNSIQASLTKENAKAKRSKNKQKGKGKEKMVNDGGDESGNGNGGASESKFFFIMNLQVSINVFIGDISRRKSSPPTQAIFGAWGGEFF
jgi:hypothetical protein